MMDENRVEENKNVKMRLKPEICAAAFKIRTHQPPPVGPALISEPLYVVIRCV